LEKIPKQARNRGLYAWDLYDAAPEGTYVNFLRFKRRNGLSSHLKEAAASKNVTASAQSHESNHP